MIAASTCRRVVTGLDDSGKSCVVVDGPVRGYGHGGGGTIWRTATVPADNSGTADVVVDTFSYDQFHDGGTNFLLVGMAPGQQSSLHATDTIDYIVILQGPVVLAVDTGEVVLHAGDFLVDRGVRHTWRNDSAAAAIYAVITIPAHPVGAGRTM